MVQSRARSTDEYLAEIPPDRRAALARLRDLARAQLPGFVEGIQYGMIHFGKGTEHGVSFASQKQYVALYVGPELLEQHRPALTGADLGKGCVRYADPAKIPWAAVEKLLGDVGRGAHGAELDGVVSNHRTPRREQGSRPAPTGFGREK